MIFGLGFIQELLIFCAIGAAIPIFFFINGKHKAKRAARAAEEKRQRIQEAARANAEKWKNEEAERKRIRQAERDRIEQETCDAVALCPGSEKYRLDSYQDELNASPLNITAFTPISKKRYVAFDIETTGLDYSINQIVEIGAVRVENGEITAEYSQLINPGCNMPAAASAVNHITDDMLIHQPKIHQVLPAFLSFIGDDVLAAHNAAFDVRFILQACMLNRFRAPDTYFDTMSLSRYWPDASDKKLSSLIAAAGVENDQAHRALGDARAVARLISATNQKRAKK